MSIVSKTTASSLGINLSNQSNRASMSLAGAISEFSTTNMSPSQLSRAINAQVGVSIGGSLGTLPSQILEVGQPFMPTDGEWEAIHYANDLNAHHPKLNFLFKVKFSGFPGGEFYYYVLKCDKPKVNFNHQDVNYYNFRTKVLTSVTLQPLTFTFYDEIGNTVNALFSIYLANRSKQGNGMASIDGGTEFSSSVPYENGYSDGQTVEIQQIFANGVATNIFTLINARIESMDFDQLTMEQSAGSMMTCTIGFDAITCKTTGQETLYNWGETDIYKGGGTSGYANSGSTSSMEGGASAYSAIGGIGGGVSPYPDPVSSQTNVRAGAGINVGAGGISIGGGVSIGSTSRGSSSGGSVLSANIQGTLSSIISGKNVTSGGGLSVGLRGAF